MIDDAFNVDMSGASGKGKRIRTALEKSVTRAVNITALNLQRHVRYDLFGSYPDGTTSSTLSTRSGQLKKSISVLPATKAGDVIKGGIGIGTKYARIQFGKKGSFTQITAKGKMLAIPLSGAMGANGIAKGSPRDSGIFGETVLLKNNKGDVIIYGKLKYVKGANAGKTKGKLIPLFLLRRSVKVPARIDPADLEKWAQPLIAKNFQGLFEAKQ